MTRAQHLVSCSQLGTHAVRKPPVRTKPSRAPKLVARACLRCGQPSERPLVSRGEARQLVRVCATQTPQQQPPATEEVTGAREAANGNEPEQSLGVRAALAFLRFYKNGISPLLPPSCRYIPTCSAYAMDAYSEFGVTKGTVLTAWRLMRCSPFGSSGYDPVKWPPPGLEWIFKA